MSSALTAAGILGGTFFLGVPLNGGTVLIFLRRKKLRHLVNFLLLLDSLSHLLVTFIVIPNRLVSTVGLEESGSLDVAEDFVCDFANIHGTLLTLSIGILRYRRLCWKKKDGFCLVNGLKWSLGNSALALGLVVAQSTLSNFAPTEDGGKRLNLIFYAIKTSLSISSVFVVVWCYACVCWRVLRNSSSQEKLRRSRSVHIRAMVHSVIQIVLLASTIASFIYTETLQLRPALLESASLKLNLVYGTATNYALLVTGTPLAYLASCHRFREEFTSLFFGSVPRRLFQKISTDKKVACGPKSHLIMRSDGKNMRHKVVARRPSTPRTLTSTTSSSTSSTAATATVSVVPCPKPVRPHHLPAATQSRSPDQFMYRFLQRKQTGSPAGHVATYLQHHHQSESSNPSPVDFI